MTGEQLRLARINAGFSLRGLAREINVPEQSIRRLENGEGISLGYAKRIADHFEVTVLDLMPELADGEPHENKPVLPKIAPTEVAA